MNNYVFGYGSLINPVSLGHTLGRPVNLNELKPSILLGYQRFWGLAETVYSNMLNKPVDAVFLDVKARPNCQCNGVIIPVTESEFETLLVRERKYMCVDVTDELVDFADDGRVTMFRGQQEHQAVLINKDYYVMQRYVDLLRVGTSLFGSTFAWHFWRDTNHHQFPVLDGLYTFV